ncbi:MAG: enoyl-CoA hydratase/isomerase family protein [Flavobacteriales bacterium]|nr:enoyl-CoA hydratase/isomerase family protein [Flavobacteriales bacterium]
MTYENILTSLENGIFTITINLPKKLNALSAGVLSDLSSAVNEVYSNTEIKAAIITGAGEKAFVAGADISGFQGLNADQGKQLAAKGQEIFNRIENAPKPFVAAVNGFALGGGCELAMACHIRVASENALFGQPEVNLGLIPGYGGTQRLIQLIGKGKAMELLMTADMIKADEALRIGLANHVVTADELLAKSAEILKKIMKKAPLAIAKVIACGNAYFTDGVNGLEFEIDRFGECCATEDFVEGAAAFVEKRRAVFTGK